MLNQKIVVVTGGAGLLGRNFSEAIALQGGIPIVADRNLAAAEKVAADIQAKTGNQALAIELDITNEESVKVLIERIHCELGGISAVVNNAYPRNAQYGRKLEEVTYSDFCENMGMHVGGYFLVAQQLGMYFRQQGAGSIVNMASIYGVMAPRFEIYADTKMTMPVEYAAIKSAIIHLTRYFAQYFKSDNIRVNCISPGGIFDNQPDSFIKNYNSYCGSKGMLAVDDINSILCFLLSDLSLSINGQNIVVDDGFSL